MEKNEIMEKKQRNMEKNNEQMEKKQWEETKGKMGKKNMKDRE